MTRFGLIGAGKAGELHAHAIAASPRATFVWVADPDRARGEAMAAQYGVRYLADFRGGLGDVDAASVCAPHHLLAGIAITLAEAGRHMVLEKPMAISLREADLVLAAARAASVTLMVGFVHRYRPDVARAYQLVRDGAIGVPQFVVDRTASGDLESWPGWVRQSKTGGGSLMYSGVHRIDRARWLLGQNVIAVHGSTASLIEDTDVDSSSAALLVCERGGRAALTQHFHVHDVPFTWETDIHGSEGMIRIRTGHGIDVSTRRGTTTEPAGPDRKFEGEVEAFIDTLEGRQTGIPDGNDGRAALAIALGIVESSRIGQSVRL
jgi:myo-inositol 2-dehydrogenase/D-chiro-inositol 1-dehydrogenase